MKWYCSRNIWICLSACLCFHADSFQAARVNYTLFKNVKFGGVHSSAHFSA